jgi:hypothetical protein
LPIGTRAERGHPLWVERQVDDWTLAVYLLHREVYDSPPFVLDFSGVDEIGQGFADEIFRVWARAHPDITLEAVAMSVPVAFLVKRARDYNNGLTSHLRAKRPQTRVVPAGG